MTHVAHAGIAVGPKSRQMEENIRFTSQIWGEGWLSPSELPDVHCRYKVHPGEREARPDGSTQRSSARRASGHWVMQLRAGGGEIRGGGGGSITPAPAFGEGAS